MEGRFPPGGLALWFGNCIDPSAEEEMNTWYNTIHIPDVTRSGIFHNATRYMNPHVAGTPRDPKYLTIYETDCQDVDSAVAQNRLGMDGCRRWSRDSRVHPAFEVNKRMRVVRHGRNPIAFAGALPQGLLLKLADCSDPAREAEFNWWYDYNRSFDVLLTCAVSSASRYRNLSDGQEPKYLALYETADEGDQALQEIRCCVDPAKGPDIGVTRYFAAFNLIYSESAAWAKSNA